MSGNEYDDEQWRPVAGFEGIYEVSDRGRVRSLSRILQRTDGVRHVRRGQIRKPSPNDTGHAQVSLARGGVSTMRLVHRMVLFAFVGEPPPGLIGCHNDDDPSNNNLSNLRWDTRRSNNLDAVRHGRNRQANQTHCKRGHEFTAENTARQSTGKRRCATCYENYRRALNEQRRAETRRLQAERNNGAGQPAYVRENR